MSLIEVLLWVIPAAPLVAALAAAFARPFTDAKKLLWLSALGNIVSMAAAFGAMALWLNGHIATAELPNPVSTVSFPWFQVPGTPSTFVAIGLRFDELTAVSLLVTTLTATCLSVFVAAGPRQADANKSFAGLSSFVTFAGTMSLLAPNFLQLFVFWQLAILGGSALLGPTPGRVTSNDRLLRNLSTDLFFIFGLLFLWNSFGTFDFATIFGERGTASSRLAEYIDSANEPQLLGHRLATLALISLCILIAVFGRLDQFPFFGRGNETQKSSPAAEALVRTAVVMPVSVYVLAKSQPLFAHASDIRHLMTMCGCLTAVIAPICAASESDLRRVIGLVATGLYGWILMGMGSDSLSGNVAAILLLVVLMVGTTPLNLIAERLARDANGNCALFGFGGLRKTLPIECWSFLLASLVLTSGIWGQNAILASLGSRPNASSDNIETDDASNDESADAAPATTSVMTRTLLAPLAAASLLLTAFSLFRAFFLTFHHVSSAKGPQRNKPRKVTNEFASETFPMQSAIVLLLAALVTFIGPLLGGGIGPPELTLAHWLVPSTTVPLLVPFTADYGSLLALIGLVTAWMMYAQPSPWPGRCARTLAPVVRLGEHGFYLDDVWNLVLVVPLRGLARCARLLEWLVLDVVCGAAPSWISAYFARISHRLENGLVQFYALSLALAATVLLAVVSWLRG